MKYSVLRKNSRYWGWKATRLVIFVTRPLNRKDSTSKLRTCSSSVSMAITCKVQRDINIDVFSGKLAGVIRCLKNNWHLLYSDDWRVLQWVGNMRRITFPTCTTKSQKKLIADMLNLWRTKNVQYVVNNPREIFDDFQTRHWHNKSVQSLFFFFGWYQNNMYFSGIILGSTVFPSSQNCLQLSFL